MKKNIVALGLVSVSVALFALAGIYFPDLGSTTVLASLSLAASLAYSLIQQRKEILERATLLLWTVTLLRILGLESTAATFRLPEFLVVWITLLLVLLATLHLCLLPVGLGLFRPMRRLFAGRGSLAARGEKALWYFNRIAFTPLSPFLLVLLIGSVAWGWERQHRLQPGLWVDAVGAISMALLWPMTVLVAQVFTLRPPDGGTWRMRHLVFDGFQLDLSMCLAAAGALYAYGIVLEYRSTRLYLLWSKCFTICLLTCLAVGRLGALVSQGSNIMPQQFVDEANHVRTDPKLLVLAAVVLLAFSFPYLWLLLLTFRPSFYAG